MAEIAGVVGLTLGAAGRTTKLGSKEPAKDRAKLADWSKLPLTLALPGDAKLSPAPQAPRKPRTPELEPPKYEGWLVVPYVPKKELFGRDAILERLRQELEPAVRSQQPRAVLVGQTPGVGTTQTALWYAYSTRHQQSVFWVHASNVENFRHSFLNIASKCGLPESEALADPVGVVKTWLEEESRGKWLMVVDGFNNDASVQLPSPNLPSGASVKGDIPLSYIPRCIHGSILFTTRASISVIKSTPQVWLAPLSDDASLRLICASLSHSESEHSLSSLSRLLDHNPLALQLASNYIRIQHISISKYIDLMRSNPREHVVANVSNQDPWIPKPLTRVCVLTLTALESRGVGAFTASDLLYFICLLDSQHGHIPSIYRGSEDLELDEQPDSVSVGGDNDETQLRDAGSSVLEDFSLISRTRSVVTINTAVRVIVRHWMIATTTMATRARLSEQALDLIEREVPSSFGENQIALGYLHHAWALITTPPALLGLEDNSPANSRFLRLISRYLEYQNQSASFQYPPRSILKQSSRTKDSASGDMDGPPRAGEGEEVHRIMNFPTRDEALTAWPRANAEIAIVLKAIRRVLSRNRRERWVFWHPSSRDDEDLKAAIYVLLATIHEAIQILDSISTVQGGATQGPSVMVWHQGGLWSLAVAGRIRREMANLLLDLEPGVNLEMLSPGTSMMRLMRSDLERVTSKLGRIADAFKIDPISSFIPTRTTSLGEEDCVEWEDKLGTIQRHVLHSLERYPVTDTQSSRATFKIRWDLEKYLQEGFDDGLKQRLHKVLVTVGQLSDAQYCTVSEYFGQIVSWRPHRGKLLRALQATLGKGKFPEVGQGGTIRQETTGQIRPPEGEDGPDSSGGSVGGNMPSSAIAKGELELHKNKSPPVLTAPSQSAERGRSSERRLFQTKRDRHPSSRCTFFESPVTIPRGNISQATHKTRPNFGDFANQGSQGWDERYQKGRQIADQSERCAITVAPDLETITISGSKEFIVVIAQQLAWLAAMTHDGIDLKETKYAYPHVRDTRFDSEMPPRSEPLFNVTVELKDPPKNQLNSCWSDLLGPSLLIAGYPIKERQHGEQGLEASPYLISTLAGNVTGATFGGGFIYKARSRALVPVRRLKGSVQWHIVSAKRFPPSTLEAQIRGAHDGHISTQPMEAGNGIIQDENNAVIGSMEELEWEDVLTLCPERLKCGGDDSWLWEQRAFFGWCPGISSKIATDECNFKALESGSRSDKLSNLEFTLSKVQFGANKNVVATAEATLGRRRDPAQQPRNDDYYRMLDSARGLTVILYGADDRAIQIDGEEMMLQTLIHRSCRQSPLPRVPSQLHAASPSRGDTVNMAMRANEDKIFETVKKIDGPGSRDVLFTQEAQRVYETLKLLKAKLYNESTTLEKDEVVPWSVPWRRVLALDSWDLRGWEYLHFVDNTATHWKGRKRKLKKSCGDWHTYAQSIHAVPFFTAALGTDIVRPTTPSREGLCPDLRDIPAGKSYLAIRTSALREMFKAGGFEDDQERLTDCGLTLFGRSDIFDRCPADCLPGSPNPQQCTCSRMQMVSSEGKTKEWRKFDYEIVPGNFINVGPKDLKGNGCVLLGKNEIRKATKKRRADPNVTVNVHDPSQAHGITVEDQANGHVLTPSPDTHHQAGEEATIEQHTATAAPPDDSPDDPAVPGADSMQQSRANGGVTPNERDQISDQATPQPELDAPSDNDNAHTPVSSIGMIEEHDQGAPDGVRDVSLCPTNADEVSHAAEEVIVVAMMSGALPASKMGTMKPRETSLNV